MHGTNTRPPLFPPGAPSLTRCVVDYKTTNGKQQATPSQQARTHARTHTHTHMSYGSGAIVVGRSLIDRPPPCDSFCDKCRRHACHAQASRKIAATRKFHGNSNYELFRFYCKISTLLLCAVTVRFDGRKSETL